MSVNIVLVETSHPGNIGATARAMKNMGLERLTLVKPKSFPHAEATARASGADDLLYHAQVVDSVDEAVADSTLVLGLSARRRNIPMPQVDVREAATTARQHGGPVSVLFGGERSGLNNEDLDRCQILVQIPTNPDYSSLNLSMAVQIFCYEYLMSGMSDLESATGELDVPTAAAMEKFYEYLEQTLIQSEFLDPENPRQLMRRLRRIYTRAQLDTNELKVLWGVMTALTKFQGSGKPLDK